MDDSKAVLTRRDFIKGAGCAALGAAVGLPVLAGEMAESIEKKTRIVLIRHQDAVDAKGLVNGEIIQQMLDEAMTVLFENDDVLACWKKIIKPSDIVGIKTNVWGQLATTPQVEQALKRRVMDIGVPERNIGIDDRGVRENPIFIKSTALINARPMRSHAWSGVGSLIKNYIMFSPNPPDYHGDSCASLATTWDLPLCKGKTRLNVLVLLTPQFHGAGPHHFDPAYTWPYKGLIIGIDPVAIDSTGLRLFQIKRKMFFGEDRPVKPTAHHIAFADTKYGLGTSDPNKIELIKLGWKEDILI